MRITVTSYYLPPADRIGAGVQMHMLANAYAELGHEVHLLSPNSTCETNTKYVHECLPIVGRNRIFQWAIALAKYNYDADVVHFGGDNHFVKRNNRRVHLRTFLGSCFAEMNVAPTITQKLRMAYLGLTELAGQQNADVTTAISTDTNRYFPKSNHVVPCGVDLGNFIPMANAKSKNPSILFVGILDSRKQGRLLLNSFKEHVRRFVPNAELWIVRDESDISDPGVKVFGSVSQEKLIELYQQAWVFCLPSSYEGFGVPYIEAMACGTPVVATPNPGALEVLDTGAFGVIAERNSIGSAITSLLSNEQERNKFTELGLLRSKHYDILNVAQKYVDLAIEYRERKMFR